MGVQVDSINLIFSRLADVGTEATPIPDVQPRPECAQAYVIDGNITISGLAPPDAFRISIGVDITPITPVIYSRSGYLDNYLSSGLDNAGHSGIKLFIGPHGATQYLEFQITNPYPSSGTTSPMYYGFLGIPEDLSSPTVVNRYLLGSNGQPVFWMNTPASRIFTVTCFYQLFDLVTGFGPKIVTGTFSINLPSFACEPIIHDECACEWTDAGLAPDTAWARQTNACSPFTLEPLPATTWTKRGCP